MKYEWDEAKRLTNIHKHGIDFIEIPEVFDGMFIIIEDERFNYGETRFIAIGLLKGRVVTITYTVRDDITRIISARKATKYEQIEYFKKIAD